MKLQRHAVWLCSGSGVMLWYLIVLTPRSFEVVLTLAEAHSGWQDHGFNYFLITGALASSDGAAA